MSTTNVVKEVESTDEEQNVFDNGWKTPPKLSDLKLDYQSAMSAHAEHTGRVDGWLEALNPKPKDYGENRSKIQPKLIRKQAEWRYAALTEPFLSTEDLFDAKPVTYEDKFAAEQNNLVLNYQFNTKIGKTKFVDEYIRTAVDEGTVIVKTGWYIEEREVEVQKPIIGTQQVTDPAKAQMLYSQGLPPVEQVITGYETVKETRVIKNHPTAEICEYSNTVIDPTAQGDMDKAGFVIHSFETSLSELELDGRYENLKKIKDSANPLSEPDFTTTTDNSFEFSDEPRKKLVVHEYWGFWDVNDTGVTESILVAYVGNTIIRMEENPFPDKKLPFVVVQYLPVRKKNHGEPDAELLDDNQKVIGAVTRGMIDLMGRSANAQMGIRKDALDTTNRRKFEKGDDYQFNANVDPRQAFYMHQYPEIPGSALNMMQIQNNEAESLTGVKAFSSGISGAALGNTATGVRSALDATSKRELGILRRLAEGFVQIGRKFISMNAEFLSEEEVVRITNDNFVKVKRDDLAGEIDLRLTISTAESDNEKAQELAFMLQTLGPNIDPAITMMILSDIAKLRKMPTLAKKLEEYQPKPDEMAIKRAQLEVALLEAQVYNERNMGKENEADSVLKLAQAREINSKTDILDLQLVSDATGRTQANTIDKEQAKGEQQRENIAAKAMLDHQRELAKVKDA
jgi:hypothetical protein